jgi:putative membrane protein
MLYKFIKALHLIFVVTWFAALFYMPRLFIYRIEAEDKPQTERDILAKQLNLMAKRLWVIIGWPSAVLATLFAVWLVIIQPMWLSEPWMHIKLTFVLLLFIYHWKIHRIQKQQEAGIIQHSSNWMRMFNEVATLVLFAVVFLVILKSTFNWIFGLVGMLVLGVLLMLGIRIYKRLRKEKGWEK